MKKKVINNDKILKIADQDMKSHYMQFRHALTVDLLVGESPVTVKFCPTTYGSVMAQSGGKTGIANTATEAFRIVKTYLDGSYELTARRV